MLSDAKVRGAKAKEAPYRLADGKGLYLHVSTAGARVWRLRWYRGGIEQTYTIGHFPDIGLAAAREARDQAKRAIRKGLDPAVERAKAQRLAAAAREHTFETVSRAWHANNVGRWTTKHADQVLQSLEDYVFPTLGAEPIGEITPPMVLEVLRAIESRPAVETAHRVGQRMSAIFVHGIATGVCTYDPASTVKPALAPVVRGRQPAVVDLAGVRAVLAAAEAVPAHPTTRLGLRLLALTAVRGSELRGATIGEFEDLDGREPLWRIPAERMKMKREHLVPLSRQAVEAVCLARTLIGRGKLLFPSTRHSHRAMSENALGYLLNRAGFHGRHVPHGFRAAFSSVMNETHPADSAIIEVMLAHSKEDKTAAAYNRAMYLRRRRELAQEWADLLLTGAAPAEKLLELPRR